MLKHVTPMLAKALLLFTAACGISPVIEGEIQVEPEEVADPKAVEQETKLIAGAYERSGNGATTGQMLHLTLLTDGSFIRGRCATNTCDAVELQTGAFQLSQSKATGAWGISFAPSKAGALERYHYQREAEMLHLELIGDPRTFTMSKLDDADALADAVLTESEVAKLAGQYRSSDDEPSKGTLRQLKLTLDRRFTRDRCDQVPCGPGTHQDGSYVLSKAVSSGQLYIRFQPDPPGTLPDRYAYEITGVGLRLREANTAGWFPMNR